MGASALWPSPVAKPSSEMERLWIRVRVICPPPSRMSDRVDRGYSRDSSPNPGRTAAGISTPNVLGDVGSEVAQGLLAALDRVVLLDRLVAQLLRGEHRAHLDPGRRVVGRERQERLEGVRVAAELTVQLSIFLGKVRPFTSPPRTIHSSDHCSVVRPCKRSDAQARS